MLKLIVGDEKGEAQNATIPVRWCVDKETLDKLKQNGVLNPHLLLVNAKGSQEISRILIPLDQALEYVQFRTSGRNILYATIVWDEEGDLSRLWKKFIRKEGRSYDTDVIDPYGNFCFTKTGRTNTEITEIDVMIPHEMFAKAPPRWLERWVNLWYGTKTRDQCHFRKRMILAFTIQLPLVLLWLLARSIVGIVAAMFWILLVGVRGIKLKPIIHPWREKIKWVWNDKGDTIFERRWTDKKGAKHIQVYLCPLIPAIPITIFLFCFLIFAVNLKFTAGIAFYLSLYMSMIATGSLVLSGAIIDVINHLLSRVPEKPLEIKREEYKQKYDEFGYLLCDGGVIPALNALPPKRRTIHLRYQDLKANLCKPFAR